MPEMENVESNSLLKVEENYNKFKDFGENVRQEYEQLYPKMWLYLEASHLEPFSRILKENDNIVMKNQDELLEFVRSNLQLEMQHSLENLWQDKNITEALISLEICKEKFKSCEGQKWNMDSKTPSERTRPIRMRFKENRQRFLKAQLEFQNKQLDEAMQENVVLRKSIQDVTQRRICLMETMTEYRKKMLYIKTEIADMRKKLLVENISATNLKENQNTP